VNEVKDGIVVVKEGLNTVGMSEMVIFEKTGMKGIVNFLGKEKSITVLGNIRNIKVGDMVKRLRTLPFVKVSNELLSRVIDPIGNVLDGGEEIKTKETRSIEIKAPGIIARESVKNSLETGVKFLDSMIPIGLGQRELLIGDPKTGKTTTAIDTILNQRGKGILCVYVVVGQKQTSLLKILKTLKVNNCLSFTTVVMASAAESAAMQYLAPFSGASIGEYFMSKGRDVLIVYDDLSKHAVAYRQMVRSCVNKMNFFNKKLNLISKRNYHIHSKHRNNCFLKKNKKILSYINKRNFFISLLYTKNLNENKKIQFMKNFKILEEDLKIYNKNNLSNFIRYRNLFFIFGLYSVYLSWKYIHV